MSSLLLLLDIALELLLEVLPFFAVGVLLAGALKAWGDRLRLERWPGRSVGAVAIGAGLGCAIPVCSCGVVPVGVGLLAGGVAPGPVFAFLAAAPVVNPASFAMTAGVLGWGLASARFAGAFALGVGIGMVARSVDRRGGRLLRPGVGASSSSCCGGPSSPSRRAASRLLLTLYHAGETFTSLLRWVLIGVLLGALLGAWLDPRVVARWLDGVWAVPLAALAGVPLYLCSCAEVPVAVSLVRKGLEPAAVLTFLLSGPGVSLFSLAILSSVLRARWLVVYAALFLAGSTAVGLVWKGVVS